MTRRALRRTMVVCLLAGVAAAAGSACSDDPSTIHVDLGGPVEPDLIATLDPGLSADEATDLFWDVSFVAGVEQVRTDSDRLTIELKPSADIGVVVDSLRELPGIQSVEEP